MHGVKQEGADGASAADSGKGDAEEDAESSPMKALGKMVLNSKDKKLQRLMERKMQNFRASQATFYGAIKRAVNHDKNVLREIQAVPRCDDRGSQAIAAIRKYIGSVTPSMPMPILLILRDYLILIKHTMSLIVLATSLTIKDLSK